MALDSSRCVSFRQEVAKEQGRKGKTEVCGGMECTGSVSERVWSGELTEGTIREEIEGGKGEVQEGVGHYDLACLYVTLGKFKDAEKEVTVAIQLLKWKWPQSLELGRCLGLLGSLKKDSECVRIGLFEQAISIASSNPVDIFLPNCLAKLGAAYFRSKTCLFKAESVLQRALSLYAAHFPESLEYAKCRMKLAALYNEANWLVKSDSEYNLAVSILSSCFPHSPQLAYSLTKLGDLYAKMSRHVQANSHYMQAVLHFSNHSPLHKHFPACARHWLSQVYLHPQVESSYFQAFHYLAKHALSTFQPFTFLDLALTRYSEDYQWRQFLTLFFETKTIFAKFECDFSVILVNVVIGLMRKNIFVSGLTTLTEFFPNSRGLAKYFREIAIIEYRKRRQNSALENYFKSIAIFSDYFPRDPEFPAILQEIAGLLSELNRQEDALTHFQTAFSLLWTAVPDSDEALKCTNKLADMFRAMHRSEEIVPLYIQAFRMGNGHSEAQLNLLIDYFYRFPWEQTEVFFLKLYSQAKDCYSDFSILLPKLLTKTIFESELPHMRTVRMCKEMFPNSLGLAQALLCLGNFYDSDDQTKLVETYYLQAVNVYRAYFPDQIDYLECLNKLAHIYTVTHQFDTAEKYYLEAITFVSKCVILPGKFLDLIRDLSNVYNSQSKLDEIDSLYYEAACIIKASYSPPKDLLRELLSSYISRHTWIQCEEMFLKVKDEFEGTECDFSELYFSLLGSYSYEVTELDWDQNAVLMLEKRFPQSIGLTKYLSILGRQYKETGDFKEAINYYLRAYAILSTNFSHTDDFYHCVNTLGDLYIMTGLHDKEAEKWYLLMLFTVKVTCFKSQLSEGHPEKLQKMYGKMKRGDKAEIQYVQALRTTKSRNNEVMALRNLYRDK